MSHESAEKIGTTTFIYNGKPAYINICKPVKKWADSDEFTCSFSIDLEGVSYKAENIGYDSMQSIILALSSIGQYISESPDINSDLIEWPGGEMKFPIF